MKFPNPACDGKSHIGLMWHAPRHLIRGTPLLGKHLQQKRTVKLYKTHHTQCTSACTAILSTKASCTTRETQFNSLLRSTHILQYFTTTRGATLRIIRRSRTDCTSPYTRRRHEEHSRTGMHVPYHTQDHTLPTKRRKGTLPVPSTGEL